MEGRTMDIGLFVLFENAADIFKHFSPKLRESVNPDEISAHLFASGLITCYEKDEIENSMSKPQVRMDKLLEAMQRAIMINPLHYVTFLKILSKEEKYSNLVKEMEGSQGGAAGGGGGRGDVFTHVSGDLLVSENSADIFKHFSPKLRESVNPDDISAHLYASCLITRYEKAEIDNPMFPSQVRMDKLLEAVQRAIIINPLNYETFLEILSKEMYSNLVKEMKGSQGGAAGGEGGRGDDFTHVSGDLLDVTPDVTMFSSEGGIYENIEYGLKIEVPCDAVGEGEMLEMKILPQFQGPFSVSDKYLLITPYYLIIPSLPLRKPINIFMEHCLEMPVYRQKSREVVVLRAGHKTSSGLHNFEPILNPDISDTLPVLSFHIQNLCYLCAVLDKSACTEIPESVTSCKRCRVVYTLLLYEPEDDSVKLNEFHIVIYACQSCPVIIEECHRQAGNRLECKVKSTLIRQLGFKSNQFEFKPDNEHIQPTKKAVIKENDIQLHLSPVDVEGFKAADVKELTKRNCYPPFIEFKISNKAPEVNTIAIVGSDEEQFFKIFVPARKESNQPTDPSKVLQDNYATLVDSIQDADALADQLYAKGVIAGNIKEKVEGCRTAKKKNRALIGAVHKQVGVNPGSFQTFIDVLNMDECYQNIVSLLTDEGGLVK